MNTWELGDHCLDAPTHCTGLLTAGKSEKTKHGLHVLNWLRVTKRHYIYLHTCFALVYGVISCST